MMKKKKTSTGNNIKYKKRRLGQNVEEKKFQQEIMLNGKNVD
jgi:hypothetical protein